MILAQIVVAYAGLVSEPLVIWKDPWCTLQVSIESLAPEQRAFAKNGVQDHKKAIEFMVKHPFDWQTHAVLRAEILRTGDVAFAKKLLERLREMAFNAYSFPAVRDKGEQMILYYGSLATFCAVSAEWGAIKATKDQVVEWKNNSGNAFLCSLKNVKCAEDAYNLLSVYRANDYKTLEGRKALDGFIRQFGNDAVLSVYAARLYSVHERIYNLPVPNGNGYDRKTIIIDPDRKRVINACKTALKLAPSDAGVVSNVVSRLCFFRHKDSLRLIKTYLSMNDPVKGRQNQIRASIPEYERLVAKFGLISD